MQRSSQNIRKGIDAVENRRRRSETTIELRKNKREQGLAKRRAMRAAPAPAPATDANGALVPVAAAPAVPPHLTPVLENLPHMKAALAAADVETQLQGTRALRKLLSAQRSPPVEPVLAAGVLPTLVAFLTRYDQPQLTFEAAWALTNVSSTEHTKAVVEAGAVPPLAQLLMCAHPDSREQAAWCLGNISGDSPELRDHVLAAGAVDGLIANIDNPASLTMLRNVVWSLSNACRGKPQPDPAVVAKILPVLARLATADDEEVLNDAGWALSYLTDGDDSRIQPVVMSGVVPTLVRLLGHASTSVITPALRTLGNIVSGNDAQTQAVLDAGVLLHATSLLANQKMAIRKEAAWMLSNLAAGSSSQISQLLDDRTIMHAVVRLIRTDVFEVKKECAWVVSNVASGGGAPHIDTLVDCGGIAALVSVLDVRDSKVVKVALNGIKHILTNARDDAFLIAFEEEGGIDKLEALQEHASSDIYDIAVSIITKFFGEDGAEDENTAPALNSDSGTFSFGVPAQGTHTKFDFSSASFGNFENNTNVFSAGL